MVQPALVGHESLFAEEKNETKTRAKRAGLRSANGLALTLIVPDP